ncbi:methyltransferase (TIGR00027 family) [Nocardia transvalensis]|uniref:S-adenosyl-L-methionine-dependent methyltransferase n=1 Tax=Nocardia transvalensis TaxID=37333 RepID=A0A7W9UL89_9NOCA|nr:class I SAM-dependent methyltransferase [Nocardia transvalensis]MBB5917299.1 methyltransferase (TIGR00027 family) [Nocardia transvalensis]
MRTEGDTWDIKSSVGSTALFVAAARALAGDEPGALAEDPFAEDFLRAAGAEWAALLDGEVPGHPLTDTEFGKDFQEFQAARTRYFDDYFREAGAADIRQVVILAAGLDARAYRLPWADGTVVYELDRPQVLDFKREVLSGNGDEPRADRREIPADLRDDWPRALRDSGFDPSAPTAWLVEGLLIYLPADAVEQLFETIDALSAPGSRVAIEQMDQMPESAAAAFAEQGEETENARNEWVGLIYNEPRSEAAEWFTARGWSAERVDVPDYLREHGRPAPAGEPGAGLVSALVSLVTAVRS